MQDIARLRASKSVINSFPTSAYAFANARMIVHVYVLVHACMYACKLPHVSPKNAAPWHTPLRPNTIRSVQSATTDLGARHECTIWIEGDGSKSHFTEQTSRRWDAYALLLLNFFTSMKDPPTTTSILSISWVIPAAARVNKAWGQII